MRDRHRCAAVPGDFRGHPDGGDPVITENAVITGSQLSLRSASLGRDDNTDWWRDMKSSDQHRTNRLASRSVQVAFLLILVVLWYLAATRWRVSPLLLPNPVLVLRDFW